MFKGQMASYYVILHLIFL